MLVTVNPSVSMTNGFEEVKVPEDWNPKLIDLREQNIIVGRNANNIAGGANNQPVVAPIIV